MADIDLDLAPFKELIKERCGLSFDESRSAKLIDGICFRMSNNNIASDAGYLALLTKDDDEFNELVNLLTINETYFFREPAHIRLLTDRIMPLLLDGREGGEKIRILSAGCSTGEEPYSIIMALMEKYGPGILNSVSVIGADIDSEALDKAAKGVYYPFSFRCLGGPLKEKYFEGAGDNFYRIRDFVRQGVEFLKLNLFSDTYPSAFGDLHVIFYRNVSIYFEPETRKTIFGKMAGLLKENGYVLVSSTETLSHNFSILPLIELDGMFLFQKKAVVDLEDRRRPAVSSASSKPAAAPRTAPKRPAGVASGPFTSAVAAPATARDTALLNRRAGAASHALFDDALALSKSKKYEDALGLLDRLISLEPSFAKAYMLKTGILINMSMPDEAEKACLEGIGIDRWSLEGYLLLGLIARARNDEDTALKKFREALYIQSSCWPAHYYLAEIYRARGETEKACREYEIVHKLLQKSESSDSGLTFFPLSFPVGQMLYLCEHNLAQLRGKGSK